MTLGGCSLLVDYKRNCRFLLILVFWETSFNGCCRASKYRPISLVSSLYKIIPKILATRFKGLLPDTIAETWATFVEGN